MLVTLAALCASLAWPAPLQDPAPAPDVLVRVLEPDGSPAVDVPVVLRERTRFDRWRAPRSARKFSVRTDAEGHATIPAERATERYAALLFGDEEILSTEESPTTIHLPATGEIRIDLTAWAEGTGVWLDPTERGLRTWFCRHGEGAELRIAHVPFGLTLQGRFQETDGARASLEITGPTEAEAVVAIAPAPDRPVGIRMRFVDDKGNGVSGVRAELQEGAVWLGTSDLWGRVRHARVWSSALDGSTPPTLSITGLRVLHGPLTLEAGWPTPDENGDLDLGDIRVPPPPLVCAGRVVDANGDPVRGARVSIESRVTRRQAADEERRALGLGGGPSTTVPWFAVDDWTDADGRFALRAHDAAELDAPQPTDESEVGRYFHVEVVPKSSGTATPARFAVGDTDVEVVLLDAGTIAVDGTGLRGVPGLRVELERTDVPSASTRLEGGTGAADVAPGSYDVRIATGSLELGRVGPLDVASGETLEVTTEALDEALISFDVLTQTFVDEDGFRVPSARVFLVDGDGRWPTSFGADGSAGHSWDGDTPNPVDGEDDGRVRWLRPDTDAYRAEVHAFGVEPYVLGDEGDGATVTLVSHPWATLTVRGGGRDGILDVRRVDRHWRQGRSTEVERSDDGTFRVRIERGVPYEARASYAVGWVEFVLPEGEDTLPLELD